MLDDTPLGRLMHDFHCTNPDEMYYKILADRVRYFKESKEGQKEMCEIMEEMERKAEKRGRKAELKRINTLNQRLKADGRIDDLLKSVTDRGFQKRMLSEYGL